MCNLITDTSDSVCTDLPSVTYLFPKKEEEERQQGKQKRGLLLFFRISNKLFPADCSIPSRGEGFLTSG